MSELPELKPEDKCFDSNDLLDRGAALEARLRKLAEYSWHNYPCDWLGDNTLDCTCRHDELRAQLTRENLI